MVESSEQIADGIASGGYKEGDFVNVADSTYRICAPTDDNKTPSSVILWTKSAEDDKPEWSKVVCIFCLFNNVLYLNIFADWWICLQSGSVTSNIFCKFK
jgi:hypothetical protein